MAEALQVFCQDSLVGRLGQEGRDFSFAYAPDCPVERAVSLTMPPRVASYQSPELHPIFQMNLPEGQLRDALSLSLAKLFGSDDLTLLSVLGRHQMGRLAYSLPGRELPSSPDAKEDLSALLEEGRRDAFHGLLQRHLFHSGVSGAQPKVLLEVKDKAAAKTPFFIAKAWGSDYPQLAANEQHCLNAARRAGLQVPGSHLTKSRELILIERFDRGPKGEYLGFEDLAVLQGLPSRKKYDSSLERCAKTLQAFIAPQELGAALGDFFKLSCLNWIIRNGDAHLKNFALLYDTPQGNRHLAPAYDLVCTAAYLPRDVPALSLRGSKRWWPKDWLLDFAVTHCLLSSAQALAAMAQAAEAVQETLAEVIADHAMGKVGQAMAQHWREGLKAAKA